MTKKQLETLEKSIVSLLADLSVEASVKTEAITADEQEEIRVQLESPEAAALIGFHGETLQALQLIFSFIVHRDLERWVRVVVNVGDYRQKREEQLSRLAQNLAMKAKFSGEQQIIPNLSAAERRIVHLALADRPDVFTQSEGEGRQRQLIIKPKNP